jgi:hypothetical protein
MFGVAGLLKGPSMNPLDRCLAEISYRKALGQTEWRFDLPLQGDYTVQVMCRALVLRELSKSFEVVYPIGPGDLERVGPKKFEKPLIRW